MKYKDMNDTITNQNQPSGGVGFPTDPSTLGTPPVSSTSTQSNFPGDSASPDMPIPQNTQPTTFGLNDDPPNNGGKGVIGKSSKKVFATILGLVLLIASVGTGVYLVGQQQDVSTRAYICSKYVFEVKQDGEVVVRNGSTSIQRRQSINVYINDALVGKFDVPNLDSGASLSVGRVPVPSNGIFRWKVVGLIDCETTGEYAEGGGVGQKPSCSEVVAYDTQWNLIASGLSSLSAGDTVRFAVTGKTSEGTFDVAKFTINGIEQPETTNKRIEDFGTYKAYEFYMDYTIPSNVSNFSIGAQVKHSSLGWF